jgi:hypothetical protein
MAQVKMHLEELVQNPSSNLRVCHHGQSAIKTSSKTEIKLPYYSLKTSHQEGKVVIAILVSMLWIVKPINMNPMNHIHHLQQ